MLPPARPSAATFTDHWRSVAVMVLASGWVLCAQAQPQASCDDFVPPRKASTAGILVQIADCHRTSGQVVRALDTLHAALAIVDDEDPLGIIGIQARLGRVHAALGDYQRALESLLQGIDAAAAAQRPEAAAPLLNDLGGVYMAMGEPRAGVAAFADSERLASASRTLELTAAINLIRALGEVGTRSDGSQRLDEIRIGVLSLDASAAKAAALLSLAELYRERAAQSPAPESYGRAARELAQAALELADELGDARLLSQAYGNLGALYADLGAQDRALAFTRQAVLVAQAAVANDALYRWEWQAGRLLRELGRDGDALASYRSAIATLTKTQAWLATSRRGFQEDVLPLYEEYADLMLKGTRASSGEAAVNALRDVQGALEQLRIAEVRNYFENQCTVPQVFEPGPQHPRDAVVIYPALFEDRAELLVSTPDSIYQFTTDVTLARLTHEIRLLREAIEDSGSGDSYLEGARRLYRWLIEPIEPLLQRTAPRTLVFVPDGPLRTLPLAVLHDGSGFLVERYALATTPGLSLLGAGDAEPVSRVLVNGISRSVGGFSALPFVAEELRAIQRTFPSRVYADETFVTAVLEREILEGGYSIVHMATHARFESDYRRSFLLAYDDLITMDDLEDMMGSQRFTAQPVDLLVLSACQTAAGDERAALGLAGVAVKAGARSALASLWFINDESTARLISEFYSQLANPANDKAHALRGAQLLLMNDARHEHPAYWAPFLMIGDWRSNGPTR